MKLVDLEVINVRGIKSKLCLNSNGENIVIFGPNGTGKSAVIDAIDFLFSGSIKRLSGRGSKGMSLKEHGPHIDTEMGEAVVKANILIDGVEEPIPIERKMSNPKKLIIPSDTDERVKNALDIAAKGELILSRAEILKYIAAEAGERAKEIQAILDLSSVEEIRKSFVTIKREADRELQTASSNYKASKSQISTALSIDAFSSENVLEEVNKNRKIIKGEPIAALETKKIKSGIKTPAQLKEKSINPEQLIKSIEAARNIISEKGEQIYQEEAQLRLTIRRLHADKELRAALSSKQLISLGISLIDESGNCPLCLTEWEADKLSQFLNGRLSTAKEAEEIENSIIEKAKAIDIEVSTLSRHLQEILNFSEIFNLEKVSESVGSWIARLNDWTKALREAATNYSSDEPDHSFQTFVSPEEWEGHFETITAKAKQLEKLSPEQEAWDVLTKMEALIERFSQEEEAFSSSSKYAERATILSKTYTETKDRILDRLYESVNGDFACYYKQLHNDDEEEFKSELKSGGAELDMKVDFYGRGYHHPRALHSEGHQDSMGLCLYLALFKKLSQGVSKLIVLDDVVMSIDSGHRRSVCRLFKEAFSECQFIITTHSTTWARQLSTDGVVTKKNMHHFKGWSVDVGPKHSVSGDVWDGMMEKLENGQIASAAHQLREHCEYFYENACASLVAEVRYKGDGRNDLGDYMKGIKKRIKELLGMAKKAANSWGDTEKVGKFTEIESQLNETIQQTQIEQWGINENVHYSKWADFHKNDFLPIVEAFKDFEDIFKCSKCGGMIALQGNAAKESIVKCPCGTISWNLEPKRA